MFVKPLILWLWIGGAVMAIGTLLAAFPGSRRRRPTDPVSALVDGAAVEAPSARTGAAIECLTPTDAARPVGLASPRVGWRRSSRSPSPPCVAGLFVVLAGSDASTNETADTPLLDEPAPEAVGMRADGSAFDLARRKGSWVVLNFFTSTCVPCQQEHPDLVRFAEQQAALGGDGAELYTVVYDDDRGAVEDFFAENGGDWPVVLRRRRLDRRRLRRLARCPRRGSSTRPASCGDG